jgi:hypothetical protein
MSGGYKNTSNKLLKSILNNDEILNEKIFIYNIKV